MRTTLGMGFLHQLTVVLVVVLSNPSSVEQ